ncbi:aldo/keto reductase [Streptococcus didelphis]|uniref:Aldo/keto reductase n=1 Tax=Streptococcus didelphis TaxID=102886 RepID=A0ABY9LID7_9STRE|nr:aldo/keto reductase [Streptococcus didelphis]WMB28625.1 aldo/keto reductase [Streptococcus didelphis]WMB29305.1 aldo/keto reductase [Streptococcus didelphis]
MVKKLKMNNGLEIPLLGFGTFQAKDGEEAYQSTLNAIKLGYRHIDTAAIYKNEESVGRAIKNSGIPRNQLFVTTKLWNDAHSYDKAQEALAGSLKRLGLDYVDLYLIHWPNPKALRDKWQETNAETWRYMEEAVAQGLVRSIGVSNFMVHHLEELEKTAKIQAAVNQIRLAPGCYQTEVIDYCKEKNILIEAWSPLGQGEIFQNQTMLELANKYQKTVAQIALAWSVQEGFIPLPKSVHEDRIKENMDFLDIELSQEDINIIRNLPGMAPIPDPDTKDY